MPSLSWPLPSLVDSSGNGGVRVRVTGRQQKLRKRWRVHGLYLLRFVLRLLSLERLSALSQFILRGRESESPSWSASPWTTAATVYVISASGTTGSASQPLAPETTEG